MENENKQKSVFVDFVQNITIFYLLLVFFGYLSAYLYYRLFDIPVFEYFNVEDFVNIFFQNLIFAIFFLFIIIFSALIIGLIIILIFKKRILSQDEKAIEKNKKREQYGGLIILIFTIILIILNLIIYLHTKNIRSQLLLSVLVLPAFLAALIFFAPILTEHKVINISRSKTLIILLALSFSFLNYWMFYAQGIVLLRRDTNKQKITFHLNNGHNIMTSDSILFLGKSTDYIFFYNKSNKEKIIYDKSLIESITLENGNMRFIGQ